MENLLTLPDLLSKLNTGEDFVEKRYGISTNILRDAQIGAVIATGEIDGLAAILNDLSYGEVFEVLRHDGSPALRVRLNDQDGTGSDDKSIIFHSLTPTFAVPQKSFNMDMYGLTLLNSFIHEHVTDPQFRVIVLNSEVIKNRLRMDLVTALTFGESARANTLLSRKMPAGTVVSINCRTNMRRLLQLGYAGASMEYGGDMNTKLVEANGIELQSLVNEFTRIAITFLTDPNQECKMGINIP